MAGKIMRNLTNNSATMGVVIVATGASAAMSDQECTSCMVQRKTGSTAVYVNFGATATAAHWLLVGATPVYFPVQNLSQLNFYSTGTDEVQVCWRL